MTVLVVDDSAAARRFLRAALAAEDGFDVVGEARTGREAVAMVEQLRPATVLMDLQLPVMDGIEAIERIMATRPTPIVVCSAHAGAAGDGARAATAAGAVDVLPKPAPDTAVALDDFAAELRSRLRVASRVRVITHPRGRLRDSAPAAPVAAAPPRPAVSRAPGAGSSPSCLPEPLPVAVKVVAVGASTGGPQALARLLGALPAELTAAVVVVQHMADGFIEGLADWLGGLCPLPVSVGADGHRLQPGTVTVAPSGRNLVVHDRLRVTCEVPPASQFHIPGIDVTFRSLAETVGRQALGVLLTGMGRDGALGLRELRLRGAVTIGQDEATCAVYGMPHAAREIDAVEHELPLEAIAPALLALLGHPAQAAAGAR